MANVAPPGLATFTYPASVLINGTPTVVQLPAAGYRLFTYDAATSTPRTTWSDAGESVANTNPIVLDANGQAQIFYRGNYRIELRQPVALGGGVIWTVDNFNVADTSATISGVFANGSAATPSVRFSQAPSSGLFSPAPNAVAMSQNGVELQRWTNGNVAIGGNAPSARLHVYGTGRYEGTLTVSAGGVTVTAGGATITGVTSITGATTVTGALTVSAGATITGPSSVTGNFTVAGGVFASRGFTDNATAQVWSIDASGRLRNGANTQISFSARTTAHVGNNGVIVFNDVSFSGGHNRSAFYDPTSGIATVPTGQAGDYLVMFSLAAFLTGSGGITASLRVNGSTVVERIFSGNDVGAQSGLSAMAVLSLSAGDQVSVLVSGRSNATIASNALFSIRQLG